MSNSIPIFTKTDVKSLARRIKDQTTGVFDYSNTGGFHHAVMTAIGDSGTILVSEFVSHAIKEVIDEDSKIGLSKQIDFIGYSEKVIKLPDRKAVRVKDASIGHLRHQKEQLIKNHIQQMQGFILHHDGYVAPILAAMEEHGFATAGDAITFLSTGSTA